MLHLHVSMIDGVLYMLEADPSPAKYVGTIPRMLAVLIVFVFLGTRGNHALEESPPGLRGG